MPERGAGDLGRLVAAGSAGDCAFVRAPDRLTGAGPGRYLAMAVGLRAKDQAAFTEPLTG